MKLLYSVLVLISVVHAQGANHEIPAVCKHPARTSICGSNTEAWYYDVSKRCCRLLRHGYCVEGGNLFPTLQKCKEKCQPLKGTKSKMCSFTFLRRCGTTYLAWFYDTNDNHCKVLNHTACSGMKTVFMTETICQVTCLPHQAPKPVCSQMIKEGKCSKSLKKWVFVLKENRCFSVSKNLCGKGDNSFRTYPECMGRCSYYENNAFSPRFHPLATNELPHGINTGKHRP
nr:amblin-like isoform X1 [Dermacentor andersoni]